MKYLKTENCAPCNEKEKPVKLKCWKVYCCNFYDGGRIYKPSRA